MRTVMLLFFPHFDLFNGAMYSWFWLNSFKIYKCSMQHRHFFLSQKMFTLSPGQKETPSYFKFHSFTLAQENFR